MTPNPADLHREHHTLRHLLNTGRHPDGTPVSLAEETRATADLRRVRALRRQLPGDPLAQRSMPRTRAEHALREKQHLEAAQARAVQGARRLARIQATDNLHSWGIHEEDVGVGRDAFRREVERGASAIVNKQVKDGPDWPTLIGTRQADLKAALQDWAVQEGCPSWWVLEGHLCFNHRAYTELRAIGWISKGGFHSDGLTPRDGLAPLRAVAAYSRQIIHSKRALPAQATPGETAPFRLLREVGLIRPNPASGEPEYLELHFSNPACPY